MKRAYKNRVMTGFFWSFIIFVSLTFGGCMRKNHNPDTEILEEHGAVEKVSVENDQEDMVVKIKVGIEKLVARGVGNSIWCGTGQALVYVITDHYTETNELFWHDITTGRRVKIADNAIPAACTPDGKWLVYRNEDEESNYKYRWYYKKWGTVIRELWRYEITTGRRQKIAMVHNISSFDQGVLSPNGLKLFLGEKPNNKKEVKMPEPKWEIIWSEMDEISRAVWFPDSSAVMSSYGGRRDDNDDIIVEIVSPKRKTVIVNPEEFGDFGLWYSDTLGRIYITVNEKYSSEESIWRCEIDPDKEKASCRMILESYRGISSFDVFSNGDAIAFTEYGRNCVRIMRISEDRSDCVTTTVDKLGYENFAFHIDISPDDRWLAFSVFHNLIDNIKDFDLYVVELTKN